MDGVRSERNVQAKVANALDKLEFKIQHNEADIDSGSLIFEKSIK